MIHVIDMSSKSYFTMQCDDRNANGSNDEQLIDTFIQIP